LGGVNIAVSCLYGCFRGCCGVAVGSFFCRSVFCLQKKFAKSLVVTKRFRTFAPAIATKRRHLCQVCCVISEEFDKKFT